MELHILLLVGLTVFLGTLSGKLFQKIKIPQVTGYIIVGLLLGQSFSKAWTPELVEMMDPLVNLALGIIGFMLGSELSFDVFRNRGRSIYSILFGQAFLTFLIVAVAVSFFTKKIYLGLLFGAIASATAPAATVDVLWEYKTRGPLSSMLLAIVALDDVLALILYAFASVFAKTLIVHGQFSFEHIFHAFTEISIGVFLGTLSGFVLYWLTHFIRDRDRILPFSFGIIALTVGIAAHMQIDLILACMVSGVTLRNIAPKESEAIFLTIKKASMPLFVIFFVLVGARLDVAVFKASIASLLAIYIISRIIGKTLGSFLGGLIGKAPKNITNYLGICLFSQAGVAIGMAISIHYHLSQVGLEASQIGLMIINITVASTFVFQLVGPLSIRYAVYRTREMGKNITEEDVIDSYSVLDLIEKNVPVIPQDTTLNNMVEKIKTSDSYDFCVIDDKNRLLGSISIGDLRDMLLEKEMSLTNLVMAKDIVVPSARVIESCRPLKEAIDILRLKDLDFLPVVKDEKTREFVGHIHYKQIMAAVNKEWLERRGA
ncbi:MAG: cation:proton antiporter [Candidatus Omnitrophica bacterium]|nr:cation:proton antiporter [Candidatus Omnitrophota bacterium]